MNLKFSNTKNPTVQAIRGKLLLNIPQPDFLVGRRLPDFLMTQNRKYVV